MYGLGWGQEMCAPLLVIGGVRDLAESMTGAAPLSHYSHYSI